jgi:hypothetical protein
MSCRTGVCADCVGSGKAWCFMIKGLPQALGWPRAFRATAWLAVWFSAEASRSIPLKATHWHGAGVSDYVPLCVSVESA